MDGFIDKFAQRKNAQDMIWANAMAEAKEQEKMAAQLSEYEKAMQEMRQCNLHTLENAVKMKEYLAASLKKIEEVQKKDVGGDKKIEEAISGMKSCLEELKAQTAELMAKQSALLEERTAQMQELLEAQKKALEEQLRAAEDFNHKEAVKVYRNVQAFLEGALPKQTEEMKEAVSALEKRGTSKGLMIVGILTLLAAASNVAIEALKILGYL